MKKGVVSAAVQSFDRVYLPTHTPPPDFKEFLASLSPAERQLHELAMKPEGLGSSYFMEKSHNYSRWKAQQIAQQMAAKKEALKNELK